MPDRADVGRELMTWGDGALRLVVRRPLDGPVAVSLVPAGERPGPAVQPLVEILAVGHGHRSANLRNTATEIGARLRYVSHEVTEDRGWQRLEVVQRDEVSGLDVRSTLRARTGGTSVQARTTVRNAGAATVRLQAVSSLMLADPCGPDGLDDAVSIEGDGEWLGEWRWSSTPVRGQTGLPALGLASHQRQDSRGARAVVSHGTWSSGEHPPAGVLTTATASLAWQVEHPGPWRTELGVRLGGDDREALVLGLLGPTDADHAWLRSLRPGEEFVSVPVSVAWADGDWQAAVGELTRHRRADRRPARAAGAVVFNDYMNTLMGDPTTDKLLPLIAAAGEVGADYFCVDAGWYDDGGDWWDSVGEWQPSHVRFPDGGLDRVLDAIRAAGMVPGLWLEPEVIGVRSPLAAQLPEDAFLQRHGTRIVEHGRYLLDLRDEQARKHLDDVVDRLVDEHGVGYFKLDYNVTPGPGTDRDADSVGDGLLRHTRAYLTWLDGVLARHPRLVVENCASGAMRADNGLLSRLELQSTTDQQEPLRYPPVAAGALVAVLPEQAGNWAYPQPSMSDAEIVFTMVTGLSGRLYLSGQLDGMDEAQRALVAEGVRAARAWDDEARGAVPVWPLGLPDWDAPWVAVGRATADETVLAVWWRGGDEPEISVPVPQGAVETVYPADGPVSGLEAHAEDGRLRLRAASGEPAARVLRIRHQDVR
ncbi:alpha-galactosidase [Isoptericola sp. NPDC056573]|uniref:alpha-galactosidase n=1 Tax=Isoptericola sp. NPDC056573 TaxID=3345868 RepID=UPI003698D84E